jgi:hypothetical protein
MTQTHEFNENLALTNKETFEALVSHYNKIEDIAKNKKFEWEDEGIIPEQQLAITYDFNEWLDTCEQLVKDESEYRRFPEKTVYSRDEIAEDVNHIKDYIDGFLLMPIGIYNHKAIMAQSKQFDTHDFEQIVEYVKNLKSENQKVFLYGLYKRAEIAEEITFDLGHGMSSTIPPKPANYLIRFAVYNETSN